MAELLQREHEEGKRIRIIPLIFFFNSVMIENEIIFIKFSCGKKVTRYKEPLTGFG